MNDLSVLRTARMRRVVNKLKSVSVSSVIKLLQFVCYLIKIKKSFYLLCILLNAAVLLFKFLVTVSQLRS